mmetsp:Transcript_9085/g.21613  ORF Transcript_9085/g.21613 Transcript_9085/m.21613 type:complete len:287 (+) Transcript_9085:24-884(+)
MCGGERNESNPSCMGWVNYAIHAPSDGPIPEDWPSLEEMKALLKATGEQWDKGGLEPPSKDGYLLPPGYGDNNDNETTDKAIRRLCRDWRRILRNAKERDQPDMHPSAESDLQEFLSTGKSGCNHEGAPMPLKMQVVILPKNQVFGGHAHPTIELELTLRGALREVRLVTNDASKPLLVPHRGPWELRPEGKAMVGPNFSDMGDVRYANLPKTAQWKHMEPVWAGKYLFNEVGSIHKSYTGPEDGAFMVLWGGIHATISADDEGSVIPSSDFLNLDHITNANGEQQ